MPYRSLRSARADAKALFNYTQTPQVIVKHEQRSTFHVIQLDAQKAEVARLVDKFLKEKGVDIHSLALGYQLVPVEVYAG